MRYDYLIESKLALFDLPGLKVDQTKKEHYFEKFFRKLLVYDQLPDDDFSKVLTEINELSEDPAFESVFQDPLEVKIARFADSVRWKKLSKDFNYFTKAEIKRRNKANPFHAVSHSLSAFEELPHPNLKKLLKQWEYNPLFRNIQIFAGQAHELSKTYQIENDKDLFRLKVNSLLAADKTVFAINNMENFKHSLENEINLINLKLNLDGYKSAYVFLSRSIESLHKIRWSSKSQRAVIDPVLEFADTILEVLKKKIFETEKSFLLYASYNN